MEQASMTTEDVTTSQTVELHLSGELGGCGIVQEDRIRVGQSLAQIELDEIIGKTKRWAKAGQLNRGLRLTLPFFDDQAMEIGWRDLEVIPRGRVPFIPAFVVIAARQEGERAGQEKDMTPTTREHLLGQLHRLEMAFGGGGRG
jgi:hypothetical protein